MSGWFSLAWLIETLIASTGLMLLVLLLRNPVRRIFGAHAAYALWSLPVLRMILPPLGALFPETAHVNAVTQASGALSEIVRDRIVQEMTGPLVAAPAIAPAEAAQLIEYRRFRRFILSEATLQDEVEPGIFLLTSTRVKGPMAFGLQRWVIVFPADADQRFDEEERAMALAHELAHHVRGDLIANAVALVMLCLHWCNPIAWIAYRAFRNDQEIACDADVIDAVRGSHLGHAYGRALVKTASGREYAVACNLTTADRLKRRLALLSSKGLRARRRRMGLVTTGAVVPSGLALPASGEALTRKSLRTGAAMWPTNKLHGPIDKPHGPTRPHVAQISVRARLIWPLSACLRRRHHLHRHRWQRSRCLRRLQRRPLPQFRPCRRSRPFRPCRPDSSAMTRWMPRASLRSMPACRSSKGSRAMDAPRRISPCAAASRA